jgi:hypothetical protein
LIAAGEIEVGFRMKNKNWLNDKADGATETSPKISSSTRRKLLRSSPALLLLANRPTFAGTCSISGFMSAKMGTSLTTHDPGMCNGWSPGNWKKDKGQITMVAWNTTGVSPSTIFSSLFSTDNMGGGGIREVNTVNGIQTPGELINYTSGIGHSMMSVIEGIMPGTNSVRDITMHAAATYLNALFLQNGGGGTNPDPWMLNYISPTDVIGLYLLYERVHLSTLPIPSGTTFRYERNGVVIGESQIMSVDDYTAFFIGMADGSGSDDWQDG